MSVEQGEFRATLGHFATGVVVITGMHRNSPVGLTCQSFFSLSLDPPMVALAPGKSSTSWPRVAEAESFCANVLSTDQEALARTFAHTGADKSRAWVGRQPRPGRPACTVRWPGSTARSRPFTKPVTTTWSSGGRVVDLETGTGQPLLFYRGGFGAFEA